jgi:hypothetical protein
MIKLIEQYPGSIILVWKLDRLARNPVDEGKIKWLLQNKIISKIITPDRIYCPEDNALIASVEFGMANQYILDLSKNVRRGIKAKLEKGGWPNFAPIGYLNDGKGTPVSVSKQALTISVAKPVKGSLPKDNWQDLLVADNTPPEPFVINLYQDPETNDGQKFIDFYATDNQTGVAYYEVLEGDLAPVRSGSPYILQNQLAPLPLKISVIAHDKAGNLRTVAYTADEDKPSALTDITNNITSAIDEGSPLVGRIIIVGSLLLIIAIAWLIIWFIISSKHKKQQPNHDKDK